MKYWYLQMQRFFLLPLICFIFIWVVCFCHIFPRSRCQLKDEEKLPKHPIFFSDVLIDLNWLQMTSMCHKVDFHKLSDNMRPKTLIYCPSVCYNNLCEFYYFSYSFSFLILHATCHLRNFSNQPSSFSSFHHDFPMKIIFLWNWYFAFFFS